MDNSEYLRRFNREFSKERKEHPKLPGWAVRQLVRDHLGKGK